MFHLRECGARGDAHSKGHGNRGNSDEIVVMISTLRNEPKLTEVGSEHCSAVGI